MDCKMKDCLHYDSLGYDHSHPYLAVNLIPPPKCALCYRFFEDNYCKSEKVEVSK